MTSLGNSVFDWLRQREPPWRAIVSVVLTQFIEKSVSARSASTATEYIQVYCTVTFDNGEW